MGYSEDRRKMFLHLGFFGWKWKKIERKNWNEEERSIVDVLLVLPPSEIYTMLQAYRKTGL